MGFFGEIIIAAIRAAGAIARRARVRHQKRQRAWAIYDVLRRLDDRTLRDLGFERSETMSVAFGARDAVNQATFTQDFLDQGVTS
jgi:uncharacterized protein YjiS (DUF1127 family)